MPMWSYHLLNARDALTPVADHLLTALAEASARLHLTGQPEIRLDIVVSAATHPQPPELAVSGASYVPGRIEIWIDMSRPTNPAGLRHELQKTFYHEYHHALRWDGPGYGETLGEAFVSEGLAQTFVHEMMDCPPEPWEDLPPGSDLAALSRRAAAEFDDAAYDHALWFHGTGYLPNWTGYAVGKALVDRYLRQHRQSSALALATADAALFRDTFAALSGPADAPLAAR
jgi:uncharacterized protein YjaZ